MKKSISMAIMNAAICLVIIGVVLGYKFYKMK